MSREQRLGDEDFTLEAVIDYDGSVERTNRPTYHGFHAMLMVATGGQRNPKFLVCTIYAWDYESDRAQEAITGIDLSTTRVTAGSGRMVPAYLGSFTDVDHAIASLVLGGETILEQRVRELVNEQDLIERNKP